MTRILTPADLEKLKEIHEKYYETEFSFPNFFDKYLSCFAVTDDCDDIICAGGVRTIAEVVLITDKSKSPKDIRDGFLQTRAVSYFIATANGFRDIHCFVQDKNWEEQLKRHGFLETKGKALIYG